MVKFEEMMEKLSGMSPEEMKAAAEENTKLCICGRCPSYVGTGETELLFCSTGKSDKITEERGCICMECPLTPKMGLRWGYYCTRGSAKDMLEAEKA
jgi:Protein of unknown function (DUF2769)